MPCKSLEKFAEDESGAVTVDWVVLTAALVVMVTLVFTLVTRETLNVSGTHINDTIVEASEFARGPETTEIEDGGDVGEGTSE